jgi:transcriptional regulator with XRE-family HTH domain
MARTQLQIDADRRTETLRRNLAQDLRRMREDAGVSRAAIARLAGVDRSVVSRIEAGVLAPTLETYSRLAAALGADLASRVYPNTGPHLHDRHQVRIAEMLLACLHPRWHPTPEVGVHRPVRGWVDLALHDPLARVLVSTELESTLRRLEQLIRWSEEKALALDSSANWPSWSAGGGEPDISRLLVIRVTRANRAAAAEARRLLRAAYPADPRDALDALTGVAPWPGSALLWARLEPSGAARLTP